MLDINRETSFVEAATGRYNDQNGTKIETQINELADSFQEYNINAMNTRSTNRSGDGSWNSSFDRSSSKRNLSNTNSPTQSAGHLQILGPEHDGNDADGKRIHQSDKG